MQTRTFPRFQFNDNQVCAARLIDRATDQQVSITTLNISPSGIAFMPALPRALKSGDTVELEFSPFGLPPIRSLAKIVRTEKLEGITGETVVYGAHFVGLPLLHQEKLFKTIRSALFSKQIEGYATTRDLSLRLTTKAFLKKLFWLGTIVTVIYVQSRLIEAYQNKKTEAITASASL